MSKTKKKKYVKPLTRWVYFTKTLYHDPAATMEFTYEKVIYVKSEELQNKEQDNKRINTLLLLGMFVMFYLAARLQSVWVVLVYLLLVVVGQVLRIRNLPKDIMSHLTDTGRRKR